MQWAQSFVEHYGYLAVFLGTLGEGEGILLIAAAFAAAGMLEPWKVISIAALGAFIGHLLFFALGRWRGVQIIQTIPLLRKHYPKGQELMDRYLDRYGHWSIFLFQYLYGTRLIAAILFGVSSMNFGRFCFWQSLNCISWSLIIYAAGHFLGLAAMSLLHQFGLTGLLLVLALITIIAAFSFWQYRHRKAKDPHP